MMDGKAGAAACFGLVTKRIHKIFRHFPKPKSWPERVRLLRRPSREVWLVGGRWWWGWVGLDVRAGAAGRGLSAAGWA